MQYNYYIVNRRNTTKWFRVVAAFVEGESIDEIENHGHAVALHFMHYNFYRVHKALRATPATEPGISNHIWTLEELVGLSDVPEMVTK